MEHRGGQSHDEDLVQEIKAHILEAYGSLQEPNFMFEQLESRHRLYEPVVRDFAAFLLMDIAAAFSITNATDLNTDHGYIFTLESTTSLSLQLSFVGPYAVLLRTALQGGLEVVEQAANDNGMLERRLIQIVTTHNIRLLGRNVLEIPVNLKLFDTEPGNVRVYQALFRDTDILPWR